MEGGACSFCTAYEEWMRTLLMSALKCGPEDRLWTVSHGQWLKH